MLMSALKPLAELENAGEFVPRHVGIDAEGEARMRISGILRTTSSTCSSLSLPRLRLVPTGSVTFIRM